ncbi:MAG: aminoacyl-tRNA hydrolase [Planctomycetota bacterium]|nr:MAG: aminoacyl-tRNA hydrolase [Planctomycetota bacterium]
MPLAIPEEELRYQAVRSSGPGGQHVNKTSTKVELRWNILESQALGEEQRQRLLEKLASRLDQSGELRLTCDETRSQTRNRDIVRARLQRIVDEALKVPKKRRKTKASRAAKRRRLDEKNRRGQVKQLRRRPGRDE